MIYFDESVDYVGLTPEPPVSPTAYQIASEFKKRGTLVVTGEYMPPCFPKRPFDMGERLHWLGRNLLAPVDRGFQEIFVMKEARKFHTGFSLKPGRNSDRNMIT